VLTELFADASLDSVTGMVKPYNKPDRMDDRMRKSDFARLHVPDEHCFESLHHQWSLSSHPLQTSTLSFWDTFEWGLWFSGYLLYRCNNRYSLSEYHDGWLENRLLEEQAQSRRRFWHEFETEAMRKALQSPLGLRGLAMVAEGMFRRQQWDLRNTSGKVVCRLELSSVLEAKHGRTLLQSCQLHPLRGYEKEAQEVLACLTGHGASPCVQHPVELLLSQAGNQPRRYSLRPACGLNASTPAREAIARIVGVMLELAASNLPGMQQDLDTEFLHDYRICLRKIRSLLSLIKGVYPAEDLQRIRTILGDLARQTNRLRDLDVYLLAREEHLGLLPSSFRPALSRMFDDFAVEREKEIHRVVSKKSLSAARRLLDIVSISCNNNELSGYAPAAELPVGPLVFSAIYRRYRKIVKISGSIGAATPDAEIHRLRIECKKMRYLMEFFYELIPADAGATVLKQLRRLQTKLGEFNDASVQQHSLLAYWDQRKPDAEIALGLGGLVSVLYQRQQQSRRLIEQSLHEFCSASTAALFRQTFKLPASASGITVYR